MDGPVIDVFTAARIHSFVPGLSRATLRDARRPSHSFPTELKKTLRSSKELIRLAKETNVATKRGQDPRPQTRLFSRRCSQPTKSSVQATGIDKLKANDAEPKRKDCGEKLSFEQPSYRGSRIPNASAMAMVLNVKPS